MLDIKNSRIVKANKPLFIFFLLIFLLSLSSYIVNISQAAIRKLPSENPPSAGEPQHRQPTYGEPLPKLTAEELDRFNKGKQAFALQFSTGLPGSPPGGGPVSNGAGFSCIECHNLPTAGGGNNFGHTENVFRFGHIFLDGSFDPLTSQGGSLRQANKLGSLPANCRETVPTGQNPNQANVLVQRSTTPLFGFGLIEAIDDTKLLQLVNNPPIGISGKAHMVGILEDPVAPLKVGRFGWKAQQASLVSFTADASLQEMGITSSIFPVDNYPNVAYGTIRSECDDGVLDPETPDIEGRNYIDRVADFMRFLAPPPQTPRGGMRGEQIFVNIGCAQCHVPAFQTSTTTPSPALRGKTVKVYSDFLLHDMGSQADQIGQGDALPTEMKTSPLIEMNVRGIGRFFHDGFSGPTHTIEDAINRHNAPGSEAQTTAINYSNLTQADKNYLLAFLVSLGRPEFHFGDPSSPFSLTDFQQFKTCFNGPQNYNAENTCAIADANQDGKVDLFDAQELIAVYPSPVNDCQCNNQNDLIEILQGTAADTSPANAIPDSCTSILSTNLDANVSRIDAGNIQITSSYYGLSSGRQAEFFYNFDQGQGIGTSYGAAFCINLLNQSSLGTAISDGYRAMRTTTLGIPAGSKKLYIQGGSYGVGTDAKKTQVLSFDIPILVTPPAAAAVATAQENLKKSNLQGLLNGL